MPVTWNPSDKSSGISLSGGDLIATVASGGADMSARATQALTGKVYYEVVVGQETGEDNCAIGFSLGGTDLSLWLGGPAEWGANSQAVALWDGVGEIWAAGTSGGTDVGGYTSGAVIRIAVDVPNKLVWFSKSGGNWNGSGTANPATGAGGVSFSAIGAGSVYPAFTLSETGDNLTLRALAASFGYSVPSGFSALEAAGATITRDLALVAEMNAGVDRSARALPASSSSTLAENGGRLEASAGLLGQRGAPAEVGAVIAASRPAPVDTQAGLQRDLALRGESSVAIDRQGAAGMEAAASMRSDRLGLTESAGTVAVTGPPAVEVVTTLAAGGAAPVEWLGTAVSIIAGEATGGIEWVAVLRPEVIAIAEIGSLTLVDERLDPATLTAIVANLRTVVAPTLEVRAAAADIPAEWASQVVAHATLQEAAESSLGAGLRANMELGAGVAKDQSSLAEFGRGLVAGYLGRPEIGARIRGDARAPADFYLTLAMRRLVGVIVGWRR